MPIPYSVRKFRCKWCAWSAPVWTTTVDPAGPRLYGGDRLAEHVANEHPGEYARIQRWLADECGPEAEPEGDATTRGGDPWPL